MNFSNTCGIRKLLSLILCCAMLLSLLAGCMSKKDDVPSESSNNPGINLENPEDTQPTETESVPVGTTETTPTITENSARVTAQLTIRATPLKEGKEVGTLNAGDIVELQRTTSHGGTQWGLITEPEYGWICLDYVTMLMPDADHSDLDKTPGQADSDNTEGDDDTTTQQSYKAVVTGNQLNVRSDPNTANSTIVGKYSKGDVVTILETKNGWGRTSLGWISLDYVNAESTDTTKKDDTTTKDDSNKTDNTAGDGSTKVIARGIVTGSTLNIRASASTDSDRVGSLSYGDRVEIYEKDGDWGRISKGWISLKYVYQDGAKSSETAKGVVTANGLNIRSGPGTKYDSVGSYNSGDRVNVLAQFTYGETTWGCTDKGWISMSYVYIDGSDVGESGGATVNTDGLNIRSGPGTGYDPVGSYNQGDQVTILYQIEVGETTWGCTSKGWISMKYVDLD